MKKQFRFVFIIWVALFFIMCAFFMINGFIPNGGIGKEYWLQYTGVYLSSFGALALGFIVVRQNNEAQERLEKFNNRLLNLENQRWKSIVSINDSGTHQGNNPEIRFIIVGIDERQNTWAFDLRNVGEKEIVDIALINLSVTNRVTDEVYQFEENVCRSIAAFLSVNESKISVINLPCLPRDIRIVVLVFRMRNPLLDVYIESIQLEFSEGSCIIRNRIIDFIPV